MPYTPKACFEQFCNEYVNLDSTRCSIARTSRDNLIDNIERLSQKGLIPMLYSERHIAYGSFARRTKIDPLDDIDLMIALHAQCGHYSVVQYNKEYRIYMPSDTPVLADLMDGENLNSRKVVNKFRDNLSELRDYSKAELHRNQEAVTLQLKSYEWNFDIVPCFYTRQGFYLIPDGNGAWKPTNPQIDKDNVTRANQNYDGQALQLIRLMKYWKRKNRINATSSYAFEILIINYVQGRQFYNFPSAVASALRYLSTHIMGVIMDPKGYQGNLNLANFQDRYAASITAQRDAEIAARALQEEANQDNKSAIADWQQIFGNEFPGYGA